MPSPAQPPILVSDSFDAQPVTRRATISGPTADRTTCPPRSAPAGAARMESVK